MLLKQPSRVSFFSATFLPWLHLDDLLSLTTFPQHSMADSQTTNGCHLKICRPGAVFYWPQCASASPDADELLLVKVRPAMLSRLMLEDLLLPTQMVAVGMERATI